MAQSIAVEQGRTLLEEDKADSTNGNGRTAYDVGLATDPEVAVYRISGAFFFGAAAAVAAALDRIGEHPKAYVIDFSAVPFLDSTGAATIEGFVRKAHRQGAAVYITGAARGVRRTLLTHHVRPPRVRFRKELHEAVAVARAASARAVGSAASVVPRSSQSCR